MNCITLIPTHLAWTFTHLLPGTFNRNKKDYKAHAYPILGPLPPMGSKQTPLEGTELVGPFIYFVVDDEHRVHYVGKSKEKHVLKRWIRPGNGGPATHYWTHSIKSGGCVFHIAAELSAGNGPLHLRFTPVSKLLPLLEIGPVVGQTLDENSLLEHVERRLLEGLRPKWNLR